MTHAGQRSMLRRFFGSLIPPENFIGTDIDTNNLGPELPALTKTGTMLKAGRKIQMYTH